VQHIFELMLLPEILVQSRTLQQLLVRSDLDDFSSVHDNPSVEACLDRKLLRQILVNLLSNATKYSPEEEAIDFHLTCCQNRVIFLVRDRGIGIPPEDRSRLFEPFHRASNVGTLQGTGLGLAIVKKCIDLHGGEIGFESDVGRGTTFTVKLPLVNSRTL